jgi:hypothetical protein
MKSHDFVWVVRIWCRNHIDLVLMCFVDLEGLNYRD